MHFAKGRNLEIKPHHFSRPYHGMFGLRLSFNKEGVMLHDE